MVGLDGTNASRRNFLTGTGMFLGTSLLKAQEKKVDGGYATIVDKKVPDRQTPIVPPGAISLANMAAHCTGCQLCVSVCPNGVLRPSTGLDTLMHNLNLPMNADIAVRNASSVLKCVRQEPFLK